MKKTLAVLIAVGLSASLARAQDQGKQIGSKQPEAKQAENKTPAGKEAHLGIAVVSVPNGLYSHLSNALPKGQGVMIVHVSKNSPAAKAGLQPDDILLTLDNQKLYSPEQFVRMVRSDKPGHEVALTYLRGGKTETAKAKLGEAEAPAIENQRSFRFNPEGRTSNPKLWEFFDELRLTRTGDHQWKAIIDYRTTDGKKQERTFSGTREEIRKAIDAEKDLPAEERQHLLRALDFHNPFYEFYFNPPEMWDHR